MDISFDSSRPGVYLPLQDGRQNCRYIEYLGDPELQPIRSYEIGFLVRFFYRCCEYLNGKVNTDLNSLKLVCNTKLHLNNKHFTLSVPDGLDQSLRT